MKTTVLIPSLLVGGGVLTTSIVISQNTSSDPMSNFIEYPEDVKTPKESVQKIKKLITGLKDAFTKLKKTINDYENAFNDRKRILIDEEEKAKMTAPRVRELARTNFLAKNLAFLLEKEGLLSSKKEKLKTEKDSLETKIKEIENAGWEYGKESKRNNGDIHQVSKLAGDFSEKIQKLYEELFLFFKPYKSLISKNFGINRRKSLSALLSTSEKVGLLEEKQNTNYMSSNLQFTRTIDTSNEQLMKEIDKNSDFTVDNSKSTLTLKIKDTNIWSFFDWNNGDSRKDLSNWRNWIDQNN